MSPDQTAHLAPHIHLARCHDDIVVLDVKADDYALLVDAAPLVRMEPGSRQITVDAEIHADLSALGLLAELLPLNPKPFPGLTGEILAAETTPRRLRLVAAINSVASTLSFAGTPFADLIEIARRRSSSPRTVPDDEVGQALAAFLAIHPWIPFEGDCLQRGYRLHHHLHRSGIPARWVFGVRTWPFLAHCWVQVGDRVVGDSRERVSSFSPILVV